MTTIRQLAQLAGVSATTVFKVLHHTGNIAPQTRQRILDLADLYHYRHLDGTAGARPRLIGCIVPDIGYTPIITAISSHAFAESYSLVLLETRALHTHIIKALQTLGSLGVKGIVMHSGSYDPIPRSAILELWSRGIPVIARSVTPVEMPIDRVSLDEDAIGELAVNYLFELGHRDIGFIFNLSKGFRRGRPHAILQALHRRGLELRATLDLDALRSDLLEFRWEEIVPPLQEALAQMLQSAHRPTALIANDEIAVMIINVARRLGLRVPQDLSVLGMGNTEICPCVDPALTSIDQQHQTEAACLVDLLFRRLDDASPLADRTPETIWIQPTLIIRESCAPPHHAILFQKPSKSTYGTQHLPSTPIDLQRKPFPSDLTDAEWENLQPLLPATSSNGRPRQANMREVLNALRYRVRTQCVWRALPEDFGETWRTIYNYNQRFQRDGTWKKLQPLLCSDSSALPRAE
jgi:LacI family transcriptional regulator